MSAQVDGYGHRWIGVAYDLVNRLLWMPTGSDRLRRDLVRALQLSPKDRVLELGCGTGLVTRHLTAAGAGVTAVDGAETMLSHAHRRAPAASFEQRLVTDQLPPGPYDAVVLSFLLHELDPPTRTAVLAECAKRLTPNGRIGILEWHLPAQPKRSRVWRRVVQLLEPPVAHDILDDGLAIALASASLGVRQELLGAGGRAQILLVARDRTSRPEGTPR